MVKNSFSARGAELAAHRQQRWTVLEAAAKVQIRATLLQALASQVCSPPLPRPLPPGNEGHRALLTRPDRCAEAPSGRVLGRRQLPRGCHSLHTSQGACEVLTRWMRGVVGRGQAQEIRHTSAQAVGTIALIDLPAKQWDDLLPFLVSGVSSEQPALRQGCLLAIGTCAS
jgi:hypothetical protein